MRYRGWLTAAAAVTIIATVGGRVAAQDTSSAGTAARARRAAPVRVILTIDESGGASDGQLLSDVELGLGRAFALDTTIAFGSPRRTGEIVTSDGIEPFIAVQVWITRRFGSGPAAATLDWRLEPSVPGVHPVSGSTPRGGSGNAAAQRTVVDIAQAVRSMVAVLRE